MKKSFVGSVLFTMAAFATFVFPAAAGAQSCDVLASNIVSQFGNIPAGQGTMDVRIVSNRSDGRYVMYGETPIESGATNPACQAAGTCLNGGLQYYPARRVGVFYFPPYLSGTLTQFFSDRRYGTPPSSFLPSYPFNADNTDDLQLTIYLGNSIFGTKTGEVVYTLKSWGNAQGSFQGMCQDGMLYGFQGNTMFVFSLFNLQLNPPPR